MDEADDDVSMGSTHLVCWVIHLKDIISGVIHKLCGYFIDIFLLPNPPTSRTILLNNAIVVIWTFRKLPPLLSMSIWFMDDPSAKSDICVEPFRSPEKFGWFLQNSPKWSGVECFLKNLDKLSTQTFPIFCSWAVHKRRHQSRGGGFAKRWSYLIKLIKGEGGQNLKKMMTSFMNVPPSDCSGVKSLAIWINLENSEEKLSAESSRFCFKMSERLCVTQK